MDQPVHLPIPPQAQALQGQPQVPLHRGPEEYRRFLRQVVDPDPRPAEERQPRDLAPVEPHGSGGGLKKPGEEVKAGGLPRSVRAEEARHRPGLKRDREAVHGAAPAKRSDEIQSFKEPGQGGPPSPAAGRPEARP